MKTRLWMLAALACLVAGMARAADLVITSYTGSGEMQWIWPYPTTPDSYRIEWAANLATAKWTDLEQDMRTLAPTGLNMSAEVPMFYRIKALGPPPENMVYIPPGNLQMGDTFAEGGTNELPVHKIYVSGFYMDRYEVTKAQWDEAIVYAAGNGYDLTAEGGSGKATNHPVQLVSWYEAVKWCNARSEQSKLTPCYYIDHVFYNIYRHGNVDINNVWVNWSANGYRLPTEAEWEKAARGGASGYRFPWADNTISHGRANYFANTNSYSYDISLTSGWNPAYTNGVRPYTSPVGSFGANGYGLYDMAGNLWEWCWDCFSDDYYASSPDRDPLGPATPLTSRAVRGGVWDLDSYSTRCAARIGLNPAAEGDYTGFRCARGPNILF